MSHNLVRGVLRSAAILFCACVLVGAPAMKAQTPPAPDPTQAAIDSLSPTSQAVLSRLSALSDLQPDEWRFHAGDIAHGEFPDWTTGNGRSRKPRALFRQRVCGSGVGLKYRKT